MHSCSCLFVTGFWAVDFELLEAEVSAKALRVANVRCGSTRLETRTKESSTAASQRVLKPQGAVKANLFYKTSSLRRHTFVECKSDLEQLCWDPKDGELCLSRAKPEETLVEARSGADVQIARPTRV